MKNLDNERIASSKPLITPGEMFKKLPISEKASETVQIGRKACVEAINGDDKRLLVVVGPCSIHEEQGALEYAHKLAELNKKVSSSLILVMRVYFEKPRTTVGWKGLINDPDLNGSFHMGKGLTYARKILLEINELGVPCATEFLDPLVPAYISDLVSWCAIGARTTESQIHRQMASGLSMPVGFKNSTSGDVVVALNAMKSAATQHSFIGVNYDGQINVMLTEGNPDTHIILRGGVEDANCEINHIEEAAMKINRKGKKRQIMIDCSHGNTGGEYIGQLSVFNKLLKFYLDNPDEILGMMLESNLFPGKQPFSENLRYGVSITDPCIGWPETESILLEADRRIQDGRS